MRIEFKNTRGRDTIEIENADLIFKNFEGRPSKYTQEGNRSFAVKLDPDNAMILKEEGMNVKVWVGKDGTSIEYLPVAVNYRNGGPKIMSMTENHVTYLNEDTVGELDYTTIENCDLVINPSRWNVNGNSGTKAYLKRMYIQIETDSFEIKYKDILASDNAINDDVEIDIFGE